MIAEAANPEWVSVPLVGWSVANALRRVADVHLVTQIRNRDAILRAGLVEGRDFTAIDSEALAAPMWRLAQRLRGGKNVGWTINTAISSLSYGFFEHLIWRRFGAEIRAGKWDLVHRVTPLTLTANSLIAPRCRRAGVPFVVGPLNGGVPWPRGFATEQRREKEWLSHLRGIYKMMPGRAKTLAAANVIMCGSRYALAEIPARHCHKAVWLPENAIDPIRFSLLAQQPGTLPLRACFIGRLVPLKGVDMAITAALPLLRDGRMCLDIIGEGPEEDNLKALVAREGVTSAVTFHGWLDHTQLQKVAVNSHLLTFPSIREFGGGVVLEAMALGIVPVVVDYGGPGELVTPDTGFKVAIGPREQVIADLRALLERVAADPSALPGMAVAARARVQADFTWDAKARQIEQVWRAVLAGTQPLPRPLAPPV